MSLHLVHADTVTPQAWRNGGGQTRELLAISPGPDWAMRISRADIAADGPFSAFPGVQRWFAVLEGAGVTLHFADQPVILRRGDAPLAFDGAAAPGCTLLAGATQDLNLMVRQGNGLMALVQPGLPWSAKMSGRGLYTSVAGQWSDGQSNTAVGPHTLLWHANAGSEAWTFTPQESGPAFWLAHTLATP